MNSSFKRLALVCAAIPLTLATTQGCAPQESPSSDREGEQLPAPNDSVKAITDSVLKIADASRIAGDSSAKVWFIIVSDFQCPYCRIFHRDAYPRIKTEYVDRGLIKLAYLNLPNPATHPHARLAAEYALCAGLANKFFEYHDLLFQTFDEWNTLASAAAYFDGLAARLSLDASDVELCISSRLMRQLIMADGMRSEDSGINQTPSFLIGGRTVVGVQQYEVYKQAIDAALAQAGGGGGGSGGGGSGSGGGH
jgi:protein-disulfide isomerase